MTCDTRCDAVPTVTLSDMMGENENDGKRPSSPADSPLVARLPPTKPRCPAPISRLRVEKIEGGLVVAGFVVAANCQIILPIFGFLFMLVGCVLTAASYRGCGADEQPDHYAARIAFTGNSRVLGPVCIVAGAIMTFAGVALCVLMRAAQRRQRRLAFHCPIHGDFYPLSPETTRKTSGSSLGVSEAKHRLRAVRRWLGLDGEGSPARSPPRCPRSGPGDPDSPRLFEDKPCPPPLPFLVPSDSVVGMASVLGAPLSPEQTFGSIRSLALSREVASFPMSRTPSPPPIRDVLEEESLSQEEPNSPSNSNLVPVSPFDCSSPTSAFRVLECKMTSTPEIQKHLQARNKPMSQHDDKSNVNTSTSDQNKRAANSVKIAIPDDGKG